MKNQTVEIRQVLELIEKCKQLSELKFDEVQFTFLGVPVEFSEIIKDRVEKAGLDIRGYFTYMQNYKDSTWLDDLEEESAEKVRKRLTS